MRWLLTFIFISSTLSAQVSTRVFENVELDSLQGKTKFVPGYLGSGWHVDSAGLTVENLTVRGMMNVFALVVNQLRTNNGTVIISSTGKVGRVRDYETGLYRIDVDSGAVHGFSEGDLIRAQRYTGAGVYRSDMRVDTVTSDRRFYATLISGDPPFPGYEYVRLGNDTDDDRQGLIIMSADLDGSPRIVVKSGVNSFAAFASDTTSRVIIGNLNGLTDPAFTSISGYGLKTDNGYFRGIVDMGEGSTMRLSAIQGQDIDSLSWDELGTRVDYLSQRLELLTSVVLDSAGISGLIAVTESKITEESNSRRYADSLASLQVDSKIAIEAAARISDIGTANAAITTEAGARSGADAGLTAAISLRATTSALNDSTHKLDSLYGLVRVTSDSVRLAVFKNGVVQSINLSNEGVKISASKVVFDINEIPDDQADTLSFDATVARVDSVQTAFVIEAGRIASTIARFESDSAAKSASITATQLKQTADSLDLSAAKTTVNTTNGRVDSLKAGVVITAAAITSTVARYEADSAAKYSSIQQLADSINLKVNNSTFDVLTGRMHDAEADIEMSFDAIRLCVLETEFSPVAGTVSAHSATISIMADSIKSKVNNTTYDRTTSLVYSNSSAISQLADSINLKVNNSTYDMTTGRLSEAESNISQNATDIELRVAKDDVINSINVSTEGITISGSKITINGSTTFASGYDPTTKTSSSDVTTIIGGYLTTHKITADSIVSNAIIDGPIISGATILSGNFNGSFYNSYGGTEQFVGINSGVLTIGNLTGASTVLSNSGSRLNVSTSIDCSGSYYGTWSGDEINIAYLPISNFGGLSGSSGTLGGSGATVHYRTLTINGTEVQVLTFN